MTRWLWAALLLHSVTVAVAAELLELSVEREGPRLHVRSDIVLDAPQTQAFAALTDYDNYSQLSRRYRESRFIEAAADGTPRIYTRIEGCVLFFCRSIERTARLETEPYERIVARVEPGQTDVSFGLEEWHLEALDGRTRVRYTHELEPDFWIPPGIGIWMIRRALERDALSAAERIEARARALADD